MGTIDISQLALVISSIVGTITAIVLVLTLKQQRREFKERNKPLIYIGDKSFEISFNVKGQDYYWSDDNAIKIVFNFDIFNIGNKPAINLEYYWDWNENCSEYLKLLQSLDTEKKFKIKWENSNKFKFISISSSDELTEFYAIDKKVPERFSPFLVPLDNSKIYLDEGIILSKILFLKSKKELEDPKFQNEKFRNITKDDLKLPPLNLRLFYEDLLGNKYHDLFKIYLNKEFYPLELHKVNQNVFDIKGTFKVFRTSHLKIK